MTRPAWRARRIWGSILLLMIFCCRSDFSKAACTFLKMCRLRVRCSAARHPVCDPADQLVGVYTRAPEECEGLLRVAEQSILIFLSLEFHGFAKSFAECLGDAAYAQQ